MSINFKPINEVPVVESLSEGDKLLVNSNGAAKQIDASKVGGSGGGTVLYLKDFQLGVDDDETKGMATPCKDAEMTQIMSTEELLEAFAAGPVSMFANYMDADVYLCPMTTIHMDSLVASIITMGGNVLLTLNYICSDTIAE